MAVRGDIIQRAFDEIAVRAYVFDLSGDDLAAALRTFDNMLAQYEGEGIVLGYEPPEDGAALSDEMGTPAWADEPLAVNLAIKLAPSYGKAPNPQTRRTARVGYALMVAKSLEAQRLVRSEVQISGSGNRRCY